MRWITFILFAAACTMLEVGLRALWSVHHLQPSLLLVLAVYVGLSVPSLTAGWVWLILGLLTELSRPYSAGEFTLIGPITLGYLVGAYTLVQLRPLAFRDSPITVSVMTFFCGLFVVLVTVAILTIRAALPWLGQESIAGFQPTQELVRHFYSLLYTTAVALPLGWLLLRTDRIWNFVGVRGGELRSRRIG